MKSKIRLSRSIVGAEEAAAFLGVPPANVATMNSGTAPVHLAVQAMVPPGGEVAVASIAHRPKRRRREPGLCRHCGLSRLKRGVRRLKRSFYSGYNQPVLTSR
ncbi:MAG: hypothetical protein HZA03_08620 [Nitrospinae bacterium]|nr:hypothetical protein [Nitrospinota bacterium]